MTARILMTLGSTAFLLGLVMEIFPALRLGRLRGDFAFGGTGWQVYFPIATSIVVSVVLTLVFAVINALSTRR